MEFLELPCDLESRYDRHSLIEWWDQSKLKTAKVLVAGTGALGNRSDQKFGSIRSWSHYHH